MRYTFFFLEKKTLKLFLIQRTAKIRLICHGDEKLNKILVDINLQKIGSIIK